MTGRRIYTEESCISHIERTPQGERTILKRPELAWYGEMTFQQLHELAKRKMEEKGVPANYCGIVYSRDPEELASDKWRGAELTRKLKLTGETRHFAVYKNTWWE